MKVSATSILRTWSRTQWFTPWSLDVNMMEMFEIFGFKAAQGECI